MDKALRLLARRRYTRQELLDRLESRGAVAEEAEAVLDRLAGWGYLDDLALAVQAVADCLARRPRGRALLRAELSARGVAESAIDEALQGYPPEREEETAGLALTRLGLHKPLLEKDRARVWRTLARLGFSESVAERVCGFPR